MPSQRIACWTFMVLAACRRDAGQEEAGVGTPPPPETTMAMGTTHGVDPTATTTGIVASGCDCAPGEYCAAPHRAGVTDPADDRLVYMCAPQCVGLEDASLWCRSEAPSCCGDLTCDAYGFCVSDAADDGSTATGTTGSTDTSTATTSGDTTTGSSATTDDSATSEATSTTTGGFTTRG